MSSRREFLSSAGAAMAGLAGSSLFPTGPAAAAAPPWNPGTVRPRLADAYQQRIRASSGYLATRPPAQRVNGDERSHPDYIGQFHKTLPHDANGIVEPRAYEALVAACLAGDFGMLESVPGAGGKLANPLGAVAFANEGWDSHHLAIEAAAGIDSPRHGGDMAECYWLALTRDVPLEDYPVDPLVQRAAADLRTLPGYGWVTPQTVFRGRLPGDETGPYVSQFLLQDVPYGPLLVPQRIAVPVPGNQWMTSYSQWLAVQNGAVAGTIALDPVPRWIANGAALAQYVHADFSYQAFLNAALILLARGSDALDRGNPYLNSVRQGAFVTFGGPAVLDLLARAARDALMAAWFQKWQLHRKLRPEAYGGLVENTLNRGVPQHENATLLASEAPGAVFSRFGTYLLPMAYPEGSPTHPSYPAGHATISGACVTVLKAFFDESFVLPDPKVPGRDGLALHDWTGVPLAAGGELNKLASNCTLARDTAGVHYRNDGDEGLRLGEQVGIALLREFRTLSREPFDGFRLTTFDGRTILV
jgi:membrane-associated phospholipid phosphatase